MKYAIGIVLAACMLCTIVQAVELPLKYERYPDTDGDDQFRPFGWSSFWWTDQMPTGKWKLPKTYGDYQLFAWIEIGEQKRLAIMDKSSSREVFFNRIHFDANANHDLTDDAVITAVEVEESYTNDFSVNFPVIDTLTLIDGIPLPYSFRINIRYRDYEQVRNTSWWRKITGFFTRRFQSQRKLHLRQLHSYLLPNCTYTAELDYNNDKYRIHLGDGNANGRFDDWVTISERGSYTWILTEGDNFYVTPADKNVNYCDGQVLSKYLNLKDSLYTVSISLENNLLTLRPVTEEIARIELSAPVYRISFKGSNDWVMSYQPEKTVLVPVDTYQLYDYVMFRDEPTGARWRLTARGTKNLPEVTVDVGTSAPFVIGEPFRPAVEVPERYLKSPDLFYLRLDWSILGAGKEVVSRLECDDKNGKTAIAMSTKHKDLPKEATYKILKPDGEVVTQGSFEYG